jgi:hypothetical protein
MMVNAAVFTCSICGETSTNICSYCTKDACSNHRCERCKRCSDCCECEFPLSAEEPAPPQAELAAIPAIPVPVAEAPQAEAPQFESPQFESPQFESPQFESVPFLTPEESSVFAPEPAEPREPFRPGPTGEPPEFND